MPSSPYSRVLLVDEHSLTRVAVAAIIAGHPRLRVCGEAEDAREARRLCAAEKPDLVVLDLWVPRGDGIELLREFARLHRPARGVVLTDVADAASVRHAFRAGAWAYVTKREGAATVRLALDKALAGERFTSERAAGSLLDGLAPGKTPRAPRLDALSPRELQVFRRLGRGEGIAAMAEELSVSVKTIETHQHRLKLKLDLPGAAALRSMAKRWVAAGDGKVARRGRRGAGPHAR